MQDCDVIVDVPVVVHGVLERLGDLDDDSSGVAERGTDAKGQIGGWNSERGGIGRSLRVSSWTHLSVQWAAVTAYPSLMITAPHLWDDWY